MILTAFLAGVAAGAVITVCIGIAWLVTEPARADDKQDRA